MTQSMSTSNAPYRLKVAVLDVIGSIGPYANFSVAPRSVSKFTVVFVFFVWFSKGIAKEFNSAQPCNKTKSFRFL